MQRALLARICILTIITARPVTTILSTPRRPHLLPEHGVQAIRPVTIRRRSVPGILNQIRAIPEVAIQGVRTSAPVEATVPRQAPRTIPQAVPPTAATAATANIF